MHQFSTPDNAIVAMSTNPPTYLVSSYLPPYDSLAQDLTPIETFLDSVKPVNLMWSLDAKSKHSLWHSPHIDTRDRALVDFLSLHSLVTASENDGSNFPGALGNSWIHITITTTNSAKRVQNWRISEEETQSDHNLILFTLMPSYISSNCARKTSNSTRKYATRAGNWNLF